MNEFAVYIYRFSQNGVKLLVQTWKGLCLAAYLHI